MSVCKNCLSEEVCRYNDGINLYCKEDYECPHFTNKADVVEVKHGQWTRMTGRYEGLFECSNCYFTSNNSTAYCEVCGAKMDGGDDE